MAPTTATAREKTMNERVWSFLINKHVKPIRTIYVC
jgi:hypothetical protein